MLRFVLVGLFYPRLLVGMLGKTDQQKQIIFLSLLLFGILQIMMLLLADFLFPDLILANIKTDFGYQFIFQSVLGVFVSALLKVGFIQLIGKIFGKSAQFWDIFQGVSWMALASLVFLPVNIFIMPALLKDQTSPLIILGAFFLLYRLWLLCSFTAALYGIEEKIKVLGVILGCFIGFSFLVIFLLGGVHV